MITWETPNAKYYLGGDGLRTYRSEKFIVVVHAGSFRSKLLQVIFRKNGSIFVDFPFFAHTNGVVSLVTYPANAKPPIDLSFLDNGKVTSHLVKFSYPPDGNAHFSQDGKVFTKVRKACPPIHKVEGHFFTVQIQGLASFDQFELGNEKISSPEKRAFVEANCRNTMPRGIKIIGMLYSRSNMRSRTSGRFGGPIITTQDTKGNLRQGCICAPPMERGFDQDINLLLTCEAIPKINKSNLATLSFIGGFDEKLVVEDLAKDSTFLSLVYPAENVEELIQKIGSIDFTINSQK